MKLCIDWEAIHQDWQASGLSKNRYFLSGRIEKASLPATLRSFITCGYLRRDRRSLRNRRPVSRRLPETTVPQTRIQGSPLSQEYEKYEML